MGSSVSEDWTAEEVAATVADYFAMLVCELRGEPYNKREHNRRLQKMLRNRTAGSIEFKHQNTSAVLIELGFPYIDGYKPLTNYQDLLRREVASRLSGDTVLSAAAQQVVEATDSAPPRVLVLADTIVPIPVRELKPGRIVERGAEEFTARLGVNYLERESRNSSLGAAGELFALEVEHRRLWESGERKLADKIQHVSQTRGDGLGYDILSFESDGRDRLIEVKTTSFGAMTPFFASNREVEVSEQKAANFHVYRVFKFRKVPKLFMIHGSLKKTCLLNVVQYRAELM